MKRSTFYRYSANLLRLIGHVLLHWQILIAVLYFLLPVAMPHVRIAGQHDSSGRRVRPDCIYLGSRGLIRNKIVPAQGCPLIRMINPRYQ